MVERLPPLADLQALQLQAVAPDPPLAELQALRARVMQSQLLLLLQEQRRSAPDHVRALLLAQLLRDPGWSYGRRTRDRGGGSYSRRGENVETRGGGIERIAEEVSTEGRETVAVEEIGREGSSEMREKIEEGRSAREEKIDEEAGERVEEGTEDTTKGMVA